MALTDYKIPIIVGRNDTPTTAETQPNHPNGSFVIKQFNDLIDNKLTEIETVAYDLQTAVTDLQTAGGGGGSATPKTPLTTNLYVDTTAVTDGDGTEASPYNTVASLIERLNNSIINLNDTVQITLLSDTDLGHFHISPLNATASYSVAPYLSIGSNNDYQLTVASISSTVPINIQNTVVITGLSAILSSTVLIESQELTGGLALQNSTVTFSGCTFVTSAITTLNSNIMFDICFSNSTTDNYFDLSGKYSHVTFKDGSFIDKDGRFFDLEYSDVVILSTNFTYYGYEAVEKFNSAFGTIIAENVTITSYDYNQNPTVETLSNKLIAPIRMIDGVMV